MLVSKSAVSLAKARSLVSDIIEDILPLSTVESPAFRKLVSGISSLAQVSLPDRKSLTAHLDKAYDTMDQRVRSTLDGVDFVWTAHNKSFFGMTVHWIDPSTL